MVSPYDYSIDTSGIDPFGAFTQAYGKVQQIRANQMAMQQAQAQQQQKLMFQTAMTELGQARTPAAKIAVFDKYPALAGPLQESASKYDTAVKGAMSQSALQAYAMLEAGDAPAAARILKDAAAAFAGTNRPDLAEPIGVLATAAEKGPDFARNALSSWLSVNARDQFKGYGEAMEARGKGEKAITEAGAAAEQRPFKLAQERAEATIKGVTAEFARPKAVLDLKKAGWDIKKITNDIQISRQNSQIAAINAAIAREGNGLKRQELGLKVAELEDRVNTRINERAAEGRSALAQADTLLSSADKALKAAAVIDPKTGKVTGFSNTVRNATGTIDTRLPTFREDVADFEALIDTLGSQTVMARIGEMKGVLSDRDLEVLRSSMASLDLKQSPAALVSNLQNIVRLTNKAKQVTTDRYGVPAAGAAAAPTRMRYNPATGRVE
jgi:hypothetical protein